MLSKNTFSGSAHEGRHRKDELEEEDAEADEKVRDRRRRRDHDNFEGDPLNVSQL